MEINKTRNKRRNAYLNLFLCILLWASIPVATKKILVELDNLQTLFYSTVFSLLVMGILMIVQKKKKELKKYSIRQYSIMFFLGFLGNYLYYILLYGAIDKTTASEGFILAYTWPMLVLVLSFIILKEKVTLKKVVGVLISFFGIIIITTNGNITKFNLTNLYGDILALSGAIVFALFSVLGKKYNFDKTISVFIYFLSALIFLIPTVLNFSGLVLPSSNVWIWIIYNGVFVNGVSYIFWFKALEGGETAIISNVLYLTPFVSLIYISIFLDEKILMSSVIGLVVIVFGVVLQYIGKPFFN
ncbi:DMT family transporter [Clostridium sediminicola]|uniref:DMT family transporter n=1 Tax=Clostridium sediminicola TaxID=3114879 RepID=UPI0031F1CD5A